MKSQFIRNIVIQFFGTGLAQVIPLVAMLVLSDLYTPEDFGVYTNFIAIVSVLMVLTGGKYQYAIVLPKENNEANNVFLISCIITISLAFFLFIFSYLLRVFSVDVIFGVNSILYYIPLYVLFFGLWESVALLSIRQEQFKNNAISKVLQSILFSGISIGVAYFFYVEEGLIIGRSFGLFFSMLFLIKVTSFTLKNRSIKDIKKTAKTYIEYPKYGIFPALLNTFSSQAIIFALQFFYNDKILGYFGFTSLVLTAPLALIGASYKDVFYQKIASLINLKKVKEVKVLFLKSAFFLTGIAILMIFVIMFFGKDLFVLIFGLKWEESGVYASILVLSFGIKLVVSPMSSIFNATNQLKKAAIWQTIYFTSTILLFLICAYYLNLEILFLLKIYVIHEILLNLLYFAIQYKLIVSIANGNQFT